MGVLPDSWIKEKAEEGMIEPFVNHQVNKGVVSYGLSSYGYDFRVTDKFKVFTNVHNICVDPKDFNTESFVEYTGGVCIIPPNSYVLARSVEYFRVPSDVLGFCFGKSTYARCGVIVNTTPFEPGWEGYLTVEISNSTPLPVKVYADEGIGQVVFIKGTASCSVSYSDRQGKYQDQKDILPPIVR